MYWLQGGWIDSRQGRVGYRVKERLGSRKKWFYQLSAATFKKLVVEGIGWEGSRDRK